MRRSFSEGHINESSIPIEEKVEKVISPIQIKGFYYYYWSTKFDPSIIIP